MNETHLMVLIHSSTASNRVLFRHIWCLSPLSPGMSGIFMAAHSQYYCVVAYTTSSSAVTERPLDALSGQ